MNKDQVEGTMKEVAGKVQNKVGAVIGSKKQQLKGLTKELAGHTQRAVGDVKEAMKTKMYADHKGRRYFFCCAGCPEAFKKNPAKYAKADSIPLPKKPGKKG